MSRLKELRQYVDNELNAMDEVLNSGCEGVAGHLAGE